MHLHCPLFRLQALIAGGLPPDPDLKSLLVTNMVQGQEVSDMKLQGGLSIQTVAGAGAGAGAGAAASAAALASASALASAGAAASATANGTAKSKKKKSKELFLLGFDSEFLYYSNLDLISLVYSQV